MGTGVGFGSATASMFGRSSVRVVESIPSTDEVDNASFVPRHVDKKNTASTHTLTTPPSANRVHGNPHDGAYSVVVTAA